MPTDHGTEAALAARTLRAALAPIVSGPALDFLSGRMRLLRLPPDAQLLRAGDVCRSVWFLAHGAIRMCWYRDGREHIGDFHLEHEFLCDYSSFVTGLPSRLHLVTTEPSVVCALARDDFAAAEQAFPLELNRALRLVAEGLTVTFADRIWSTLMDTPTERYLALQRDKPEWFTRFPQYMLASYLGLTPEGLSKLRKRLDTVPARTRGRTRSTSEARPPRGD